MSASRYEALETLRYFMAVHFGESDSFAAFEESVRKHMAHGGDINVKARREAAKQFEDGFESWVRGLIRDELKKMLEVRDKQDREERCK